MNKEEERAIRGLSEKVKEAIRRRVDERGMTLEEAMNEVLSCGPGDGPDSVA